MKKRFTIFFLYLIVLACMTGCATVFGGAKNKLVVKEGIPPQADVYIDGLKLGTAPIDQKISKYMLQEGSVVEIRKQGFQTDSIIIQRKIHPWYALADIVAGVGVGFAIDFATGNIYRPDNNKISYTLRKEN